MNDGCYEMYTQCAICGCVTNCITFVTNGSYAYVDDNERPKWFCPSCIKTDVRSPEGEDEDDSRAWCKNCGELVYPNEDNSCPECGCNVYTQERMCEKSWDTHESIRDLAIELWDNRARMTFSELADELGFDSAWHAGQAVTNAWRFFDKRDDSYACSAILRAFHREGEV